MTGNDMVEAMSFVDERYIEEAEAAPVRRKIRWQGIAAMAACLGLVVFSFRFWMAVNKPAMMMAQSTSAVSNEMSVAREEAAEDMAVSFSMIAEPRAASTLPEMTVRVLSEENGILTAAVTDPGSSTFAMDEEIQITLPDGLELPEAGEDGCYLVIYSIAEDGSVEAVDVRSVEN